MQIWPKSKSKKTPVTEVGRSIQPKFYSASPFRRVPDKHTGSLVKFEFQIKNRTLLRYKYVPCNIWDMR